MKDFIKELCFIKTAQREYLKLFGKKLVVDIHATKDVKDENIETDNVPRNEIRNALQKCLTKYGASLECIRSGRCRKDSPEAEAVREFCNLVIKNKWNQTQAANLINRDRSSLRHFSGYGLVRKKRKQIHANQSEGSCRTAPEVC